MIVNIEEIIKAIDSVKVLGQCDSIGLCGNKESFIQLKQAGFPIEDFKCHESELVEDSKIMIIPASAYKPVKIYYEDWYNE